MENIKKYRKGNAGNLTAFFYWGIYLPSEVVEQCYRIGKLTNINKVQTGNGFTHSTLTLPPAPRKVKILIEPNLKVIMDKEKGFTGERYLYLHSQSAKTIKDWNRATQYIVTTTDTFRHIILPTLIKEGSIQDIESITIDEFHKIPDDSSYRSSLVDYYYKVSLELLKANPDLAIVNVTATPPISTNPFYYESGYDLENAPKNPYKIDILLAPQEKPRIEIYRNNNEAGLIQQIKDLRSRGKRVMVYGNQIRIIYQFIEDGKLNAKLIAGVSVSRAVYYRAKVENNEDFIISTSSGFEGWSAKGDDWHIFIFSDCNDAKYTISLTGLQQVIGRPRDGARKIIFCEVPFFQSTDAFGNVRSLTTAFDEIEKLKERKTFRDLDLIKSKLHRNEHLKKSRDIITSTAIDYEYEEGMTILKTRPIWEQLYADAEAVKRRLTSINDPEYIDCYWAFKNIHFIDEDLNLNRVIKVYLTKSRDYLIQNREAIVKKGLCDYRLTTKGNSIDVFLQEFSEWLFFRSLPLVIDESNQNDKITIFKNRVFKTNSEGVLTPDTAQLDAFLDRITNERLKDIKSRLKSAKKLADNQAQARELTNKILNVGEGNFQRNILKFLALLLNDSKNMIDTPANLHRQYNVSTNLDLKTIEAVCVWFGIEVQEFDVRSCAWRVVYALCGLPLPDNFYGSNKKHKRDLNILLNTIAADAHTKQRKSSLEDFIKKKKKQLENRGVPAKVYNWLLDNFSLLPSDVIFNTYTHHEELIVNEIINLFPLSSSLIRRHDSILVFDFDWECIEGEAILNKIKAFQYLGFYGWFDSYKIKEQESGDSITDINF